MWRHILCLGILIAFSFNAIGVYSLAVAEQWPLPAPGVRVSLSPDFVPAQLTGISFHPEDALRFDFYIHQGDRHLSAQDKKIEYTKLVKYFLASLAVPDENQWVNLSPYEKNRIIPDDFGKTEMGRDLLAQDYMLKQITASIIYPQEHLGQRFWDELYKEAYRHFGTNNLPFSTFNKVWIIPDQATVYASGNSAYILSSHLKVLLEEDYLSLEKHALQNQNQAHTLASKIIRALILPALEKEVNTGKNFANLRQMYSGMILATWFKKALKSSLLGQAYADKSKLKGIDQNPGNNLFIYKQYVKAFKKGVFNYIKEDVDTYSHQLIPRKYFSGGFNKTGFGNLNLHLLGPGDKLPNAAMIPADDTVDVQFDPTGINPEVYFLGELNKSKPEVILKGRGINGNPFEISGTWQEGKYAPDWDQFKSDLRALIERRTVTEEVLWRNETQDAVFPTEAGRDLPLLLEKKFNAENYLPLSIEKYFSSKLKFFRGLAGNQQPAGMPEGAVLRVVLNTLEGRQELYFGTAAIPVSSSDISGYVEDLSIVRIERKVLEKAEEVSLPKEDQRTKLEKQIRDVATKRGFKFYKEPQKPVVMFSFFENVYDSIFLRFKLTRSFGKYLQMKKLYKQTGVDPEKFARFNNLDENSQLVFLPDITRMEWPMNFKPGTRRNDLIKLLFKEKSNRLVEISARNEKGQYLPYTADFDTLPVGLVKVRAYMTREEYKRLIAKRGRSFKEGISEFNLSLSKNNPAMRSIDQIPTETKNGGIDFNAKHLNLAGNQVFNPGGFKWRAYDTAQLSQMQGLNPLILAIVPVRDLPILQEIRQQQQAV